MIIRATPEQVTAMAKAAILASIPMGMGITQHNPNLKAEDIELNMGSSGGISVDYYAGRMVKFHARRIGDNNWEFSDTTSYDYQSWKSKYDSYQALFDSVKGE